MWSAQMFRTFDPTHAKYRLHLFPFINLIHRNISSTFACMFTIVHLYRFWIWFLEHLTPGHSIARCADPHTAVLGRRLGEAPGRREPLAAAATAGQAEGIHLDLSWFIRSSTDYRIWNQSWTIDSYWVFHIWLDLVWFLALCVFSMIHLESVEGWWSMVMPCNTFPFILRFHEICLRSLSTWRKTRIKPGFWQSV